MTARTVVQSAPVGGGIGRRVAVVLLAGALMVGVAGVGAIEAAAPEPGGRVEVEAGPEAAVTEQGTQRPPLRAGYHQHRVNVDGQMRRWATFVPPGLEDEAPNAIVFALHGVGGRGADMRNFGFEASAAGRRTVLVYPDAHHGAWNDGRPGADPIAPGLAADDVRFLRLLIDEVTARTGAGPRRVAVVGFSAGAIMAGRTGCELADRVAAIAVVGGTAGQGFEKACQPALPVAAMAVAGTADPIVPYGGGRVADWAGRKRGSVASVDEFFAFWAARAGCRSTQATPPSAPVHQLRGEDCAAGTLVVRHRVHNGGHDWFRPPVFDTTGAIWDFLSRPFPMS